MVVTGLGDISQVQVHSKACRDSNWWGERDREAHCEVDLANEGMIAQFPKTLAKTPTDFVGSLPQDTPNAQLELRKVVIGGQEGCSAAAF